MALHLTCCILKVKEAYSKAQSLKMIKRDTRWTIVFEDFDYGSFTKNSPEQTNFLEMRHGDNCCIIKNEQGKLPTSSLKTWLLLGFLLILPYIWQLNIRVPGSVTTFYYPQKLFPTGSSCNCKPMPNIPHTIIKNGAHMLAKGLADMKGAGNLPLLGK